MYEAQDYNSILARILNRIPEDDDVRPSSPLYIVSGPAAKEMEVLYKEMDYTLDQVFPITANRYYLIKDALTYGISPYDATYAVVEGEFNIEIDIGTRFSKDGVYFTAMEKLEKEEESEYFYYRLECETAGEVGNVVSGKILPIWNIPNLTHAFITRILIAGEEVEDTESFRERYLASFKNKRYGGNLADYINEVCALDGVGRVKVLRCIDFEGNITPEWVGIVITDSQFKKPTEELIQQVQEHVQPLGVSQLPELETSGLGIAPISHLAHVRGVNEEEINIQLKLTYSSGYSWQVLKVSIQEKISEYLQELASSWGDIVQTDNARNPMDTHLIVVRSRIESILLDIEGIIDANDTIINDKLANYNLAWDAIPKLGEITEYESVDPDDHSCPYNCPDCKCNRDASQCHRVEGV